MKQLGLSLVQYSQDYDERMPAIDYYESRSLYSLADGIGWNLAINPYVKSTQVYKCPSEQNLYNITPTSATPSYGLNWNLLVDASSGNPITLASWSAPAVTVMLFESVTALNTTDNASPADTFSLSLAGADDGLCTSNGSTTPTAGPMSHRPGIAAGFTGPGCSNSGSGYYDCVARHFDGANFLMADGHVKYSVGRNISTGTSAANAANAEDTSCPSTASAKTLGGSSGDYYGCGGYSGEYASAGHCAAGTSALNGYMATFSSK